MKLYKIILLNICFLIIAKFNHLNAYSIGCRCEFNGTQEIIIKSCVAERITKENKDLPQNDNLVNLENIKIGECNNGDLFNRYELSANQWVWLRTGIARIRIILKPNIKICIFPYDHVYFFNVFAKTLNFKINLRKLEEIKPNFWIKKQDDIWYPLAEISRPRFIEEENSYVFELQHGQALSYPGESGIQITLEA